MKNKNQFIFCILLLATTAYAMSSANAAVLRVNAASAAVSPDGLTWEMAFPSIKQAVNVSASGDEIWVAAGTYPGYAGTEAVFLKSGITLYGGFKGAETSRDQRDWKANKTIIDGQGSWRGVTATDVTSMVDGFTIQNGNATSGGGMYQGTAVNCTFTGNSANYGGGKAYGTATNCVFYENHAAHQGGGIYNGKAVNCTLSLNSSPDGVWSSNGGGMFRGTASNCVIWGNNSKEVSETTVTYSCLPVPVEGSGNIAANPMFVNLAGKDLRLRANSPCVNTATAEGSPAADILGRSRPQGAGVDMGAYEYYSGDDTSVADPVILRVNGASSATTPDGLTWETAFPTLQAAADRCTSGGEIWVVAGTYLADSGQEVVKLLSGTSLFGGFAGTEASRDQRGPTNKLTVIDGLDMRRGVTACDSCIVEGFVVRNGYYSFGGGMYYGTAINCVFTANKANWGGGLFYGVAKNCTFWGNRVWQEGGGMYGGVATNCILWGNKSSEVTNTVVSYSYYPFMPLGMDSITADPLFVVPWAGDFRLRADSPCIDIGTAEDAPGRDILGRPRSQGAGVDIGAYEYYEGDDTAAVEHTILRVNALSTAASPDGLTWETAFSSIKEAANLYGHLGEIWVAKGTYDGEVILSPGISMYGGFAGTELSRDQRDAKANPTIIDGQSSFRCVKANDSSLVDGFTLQNGLAGFGAGMAGGMAVNCNFIHNNCGLWDTFGGGGFAYGTAVKCTFTENTSTTVGGGVYSGNAVNCTFYGNNAPYGGGGLINGTAINCTFTGNGSSKEGSGMLRGRAVNCIFSNNWPELDQVFASTVTYSCLPTLLEGEGNIAADPQFADAASGDFRLMPGSPCIDAGTATYAGMVIPQVDILGIYRPQGLGTDIGAVESEIQTPVPDVSGLVQITARQLINATQLYVGQMTEEHHPTIPADHVVRQNPVAETQVRQWTNVDLVISTGPRPVTVPYIVGQTQDVAVATISDAGLMVGEVTQEHSQTVPEGNVITQSPASGTEVLPGTTVDLTVSLGPESPAEGEPQLEGEPQIEGELQVEGEGEPQVEGEPAMEGEGEPATQFILPALDNMPLESAGTALAGLGLQVGTVTYEYSDTIEPGGVISQYPPANSEVAPGIAVNLVISLGPKTVPPGCWGDITGAGGYLSQLGQAFMVLLIDIVIGLIGSLFG